MPAKCGVTAVKGERERERERGRGREGEREQSPRNISHFTFQLSVVPSMQMHGCKRQLVYGTGRASIVGTGGSGGLGLRGREREREREIY